MSVFVELRRQVYAQPEAPDFLTIREDQIEELVRELGDLSYDRTGSWWTADKIRSNACNIFGIPLRVTPTAEQAMSMTRLICYYCTRWFWTSIHGKKATDEIICRECDLKRNWS